MSKGSNRRPEAIHGTYAEQFERIFQAGSRGNIKPMPQTESINRPIVHESNEVIKTESNCSGIKEIAE